MVSLFRDDRGSVTFMTLTLAFVIIAMTFLAMCFGRLIIEQRQVQMAADSSALAGARSLIAGSGNPCGIATELAQRNHANVEQCFVSGSEVKVSISMSLNLLGYTMQLSAQARAGLG